MIKYEVQFMEPAKEFLDDLDDKTREKVIFNIWKSRETNDPDLFKKLTDEIWEFRTRYKGKQIRLLAFWDKIKYTKTLVIATHGFQKKAPKVPKRQIDRAMELRQLYYEQKSSRDG
jgi:phage-related protein